MITIIIVSKDNEVGIAKTLSSIKCKKITSYEIIIKRFSPKTELARRDNIIEIYGPDKGIYDAMNLATKYANYNWLCFMNAGDQFVPSLDAILTKVSENTDKKVLYGDHIVDEKRTKKARSIKHLRFGSAFCHQSAIIRSDALKNGYDIRYNYAADYDLFASIFTSENSFLNLDFIISNIESGGVSDKHRLAVYKEWRNIQKHYFKCDIFNLTLYFVRVLREIAKSYVYK